ncbi:response regulator [Ktedonobacter racemifer]|uniref:Response regulator receiver protein n=1 Tax=Ktedonobacter racemifer DSM 44963 TaxID=485913 RepID=D6TPE2_KTERA|nr:response regulator [Ktedonobacter racemifer]EFH87498.1 response regulator receiver protein [Ktedonobacter racemifer DSM 44963]
MQYMTESMTETAQEQMWQSEPSTEELAAGAPQSAEDKTILIVEDDDYIGSMLVEALRQETPYRPLLVNDGMQALTLVKQVKPCLIITDYRLPLMNGIELYDRLHTLNELAETPTIMMSAYLPPQEEMRKRNLVALNKPFELDEFLDKVDSLLQC